MTYNTYFNPSTTFLSGVSHKICLVNVPSCVKVEATKRVEIPGGVDDGAENSIVGIWQRPIFVIYEVVERGLCRFHDLQRCNSLRHLWLSYNKRVE